MAVSEKEDDDGKKEFQSSGSGVEMWQAAIFKASISYLIRFMHSKPLCCWSTYFD
jgi:hypothetical protein